MLQVRTFFCYKYSIDVWDMACFHAHIINIFDSVWIFVISEHCVISALQKHLVDMNIEGLDSSYLHWIVSTSGSHSSLSSADVSDQKKFVRL